MTIRAEPWTRELEAGDVGAEAYQSTIGTEAYGAVCPDDVAS